MKPVKNKLSIIKALRLEIEKPINESYDYPTAGEEAQPEVKDAIDRWRELPEEERTKTPLLYWLLGEGTSDFKMSPEDSEYTDNTTSDMQSCANCEFLYLKKSNNNHICSQIEGDVLPEGWCKLWRQGE